MNEVYPGTGGTLVGLLIHRPPVRSTQNIVFTETDKHMRQNVGGVNTTDRRYKQTIAIPLNRVGMRGTETRTV